MNNKIIEDLKNAMKQQDKFKTSVLRILKSAIQMESISAKKELTDDEVIKVIKRQVKTRKDSISEYEKFGKDDVVKSLNDEIEILNCYLPEEMSEDDLRIIVDKVFEDVKPSSMKDMGLVMKQVNEQLSSINANADMSLVSKLVKEKLS